MFDDDFNNEWQLDQQTRATRQEAARGAEQSTEVEGPSTPDRLKINPHLLVFFYRPIVINCNVLSVRDMV